MFVHPHPDTPSPHSGVLLEDNKMVESPLMKPIRGHEDVIIDDSATPAADVSMASLEGGATSAMRSYPEGGDEHEPPAKRARLTDTDMASTAQVNFSLSICARLCDRRANFSCVLTANIKSTSPPPASANPAPIPLSNPLSLIQHFPIGDTSFNGTQWYFCLSTIKTLKKQKDAAPFNQPVDPIALNIPHYPSIVKTPIDFLPSIGSCPPPPIPPNRIPTRAIPAITSAFIADVRLIFSNTLKFNGPEHVVIAMGKRLGEVFDK
jgi:bromodomain-containing factor 1